MILRLLFCLSFPSQTFFSKNLKFCDKPQSLLCFYKVFSRRAVPLQRNYPNIQIKIRQ